MRLQLKPNFRYDRYTVQTGGKTIVTYDRDTERVTIRYCGMTQTIDVIDGVSWVKTAFLAFNAAGWHNPWNNVATDADDHADAELTAAAEGEGPAVVAGVDHGNGPDRTVYTIAVQRLCAVDRLEAAGYVPRPTNDYLLFESDGNPAIVVEWYPRTRQARAGVDGAHLRIKSDPCPGLNAALESLLSKPVGAVTVAQILGVAP